MINLNINGEARSVDVTGDTPVLWVLRDVLGLTGTKFGCGVAQCGACTVHVDGAPMRSCVLPVSAVAGRKITTIEALENDPVGAKLQEAWLGVEVVQCGYCQSGQLMSAAALLHKTPNPTDAQIDAAMSGNICRCGTYPRIRAAIKQAATGQKIAAQTIAVPNFQLAANAFTKNDRVLAAAAPGKDAEKVAAAESGKVEKVAASTAPAKGGEV